MSQRYGAIKPRCAAMFLPFWCLLFLLVLPQPAWALRAVFLSDTQGDKGPGYNGINTEETTAAVRAVLAMKPRPDMVYCLGDLAGRGFTESAGWQFEAWKDLMRPITQAGIPLYVLKGNHELTRAREKGDPSSVRYFLRNQEEFAKAFSTMPANGPKGYEHLAYTVTDKATATVFVALDSYYLERDMEKKPYGSYGYISQVQLDWLRALPGLDRAAHRIVLTHAPAFNVKKEHPGFANESFQRLWETLEDKKVDLLIAAHLHVFSFAVVDGALYPASRRPVAQLVIGPVGGELASKKSVRSNQALWDTFVGRNFVLLEISGPDPDAPIKITPYVQKADGEYRPTSAMLLGKPQVLAK